MLRHIFDAPQPDVFASATALQKGFAMNYGDGPGTLAASGAGGVALYGITGSLFLVVGVVLIALAAFGIRHGFRRHKSAIEG